MKTLTIQVNLTVQVPDNLTPEQARGLGIRVDPASIRVMQDYHIPLPESYVLDHTTVAVLDENGEEV